MTTYELWMSEFRIVDAIAKRRAETLKQLREAQQNYPAKT